MSMGETEVIGQYGCMLMRTLIKRRKKMQGLTLGESGSENILKFFRVNFVVRTCKTMEHSTHLRTAGILYVCVCERERERDRERGSHDEQEVQRARPNVVQLTDLTRSCFRYLFPAEACNR